MHCLTAWAEWAVELLQRIASLHGDGGQWNSCNDLPYCLGAVSRGTPSTHCLTTLGLCTMELLQCSASLLGTGQRNLCTTLPDCLGAVGNGSPATHCLIACG